MKSPGYLISQKISQFFRFIGVLVSRNPAPFFWGPVLLTLFSAIGLLRFYEENKIWYLYSPSGARSHYEHAIANEFFNDRGGKFWAELTITAKDFGSLLRPKYLNTVVQLTDFLQNNLTVPCDVKNTTILNQNPNCSWIDLCTGPCNDNEVIPLFHLIYHKRSSRLHPNFRLTYPTMHLYNDEYYVGEHFGGVEINQQTQRISNIKVVVLYFRTDRQNDHVSNILDSFEDKLHSYATTYENPQVNITVNSDRVIAKEVRRNGMSAIPYFSISILSVFIFILITNRREHFPLTHSIVMSFLGIIGPLMAVATTFCLLFLFGFPFNSITLVMPFLIIGVGSDDVFIIIHCMRRTNPKHSLEEQIAETMEEAGPSITVTSLTNILSFGIGILTPTPAISLFCLYTCIAVLLDYIYQLTFFVAALVYEERRVTNNHITIPSRRKSIRSINKIPDIEIKDPIPVEIQHPSHHNGVVTHYCTALSSIWIRLTLLVVMLFYWTVSLYGCTRMEVKMDTTNLVAKDSSLNNVAYIYEKFLWSEGQLVFVFVNSPPDVSTATGQHDMLDLVDRFERLPYSMGRNSTSFWLRSYLYQMSLYQNDKQHIVGFYPLLDVWLLDAENGGARWNDMIRLRRNGSRDLVGIDKFMFATGCAMGDDASWITRQMIQRHWRETAAMFPQYNVSIFQAYSFYVDQLDSIGSNTLSTVIVAALTMDLACYLMIPSASSIITSSLAMLSINIGVFGLLSWWNVSLDPITMCSTLMSIGFSVDFTGFIEKY
ncbi:hypothetical protein WR25_06406 isoform G [Diploscapter pachys]|uniref:SSD domain-containing protein n=1 Tax=Diploscapter pachys TaxID=2018661 RepID=A0A2A2LYX1_9BILA|nr:hypothetical protein WR25_06406 isoform B [Diploscapter pachys]PAV91441.1 hypothetical protein WR25_06406 isoform G [Diploscapter pachys]